jgi:hypothetical protein
VTGREFGVIGAYDGHRVGVGRVAVDSSWHHFFNINLKGDCSVHSGPKKNGFHDPSVDPNVYEDIKSYFRNLGVWLAPKAIQTSMRDRALWVSRWKYPLIEELPSLREPGDVGGKDAALFQYIGLLAYTSLVRMSSDCQAILWILDIYNEHLREQFREQFPNLESLIDPWHPEPPPDQTLSALDGKMFLANVLGGVLLHIAAAFPDRERADDKALKTAVSAGAHAGTSAMREMLKRSVDDAQKSKDSINQVLRSLPS